eukprot:GHVS01004957.1.p2 GENE.GHVS01004957.1~~GHVS01004957.1.p2  ORF type:complete len:100 (-),score=13.29 GHVS01004957.1:1508-1807(-)
MQKNTLSTLSGQVTQLSKDLEQQKETKKEEDDEAASEADSGAVHMTIKYPGSETAGGASKETPAKSTPEGETGRLCRSLPQRSNRARRRTENAPHRDRA